MGSLFTEHKTITFALVGALVAVGLWYGLSSGGTAPSSLLSVESAGTGSAADQNLVSTLLQLRAVSLSGSILSEPAFMSLRDFGTQIVPEPIGRPNPFAPLGQTVRSTSTARSSQLFPSTRP